MNSQAGNFIGFFWEDALMPVLNSTFSAGYAEAADRNGRLSHELMVSLKLL